MKHMRALRIAVINERGKCYVGIESDGAVVGLDVDDADIREYIPRSIWLAGETGRPAAMIGLPLGFAVGTNCSEMCDSDEKLPLLFRPLA